MASCPSCGFDVSADSAACSRCGAALRDPLLGAVLGDRYLIQTRIGEGGMGAVYLAQHTTLKRDVAIKVLLPEFGGKEEFVRRFEREAASASRLSHPNIIAVTDFGRTPDGLLFLAMEYLDGHSLTSVIREGPLAVPRALGIARQILAGLNRAHGAGVIHRDLKPDNIMLIDRDGTRDFVKILDFGIAKITDVEQGREALTQAGMVFGTPEYLSPEQALGDKIDARADLYALGVMLFEMLTGSRPFESDDKVRIISMHLSHTVPRMAVVNPAVNVPVAVEEAVQQALDKQRENRFSSASAFLVALEEAERLSAALTEASQRSSSGTPSPMMLRPTSRGALTPGPTVPDTIVSTAPSGLVGAAAAATPSPTPARSRWKRVVVFGGAAAVLAAGAIVVPSLLARPKVVATGRVPAPQPTSVELTAKIKIVEGLLATGETVKARVALEQLLADNPQNARIRYLLGRLAFADDRQAEGLSLYREAVGLDAGLRADPVLLEHLGVALGRTKLADAALDLAIEKIGRPAADLLVKVANNSTDLQRRERAAHALDELGEGKRVDQVMLRVTELKGATTCEERLPLVVTLGESDDVRALPALRAQRPRGLDAFFGNDAATACMRTELTDAIARLEAKLPADKRPAQKQPPPHRTGARSPFSRGR